MTNELATRDNAAAVMEQVVIQGDLGKLQPEQRAQYYLRVCESLGLNPLTRPFEYIVLNGRLTLYARRDCTDQLRRIYSINLSIVSRERMDDLYIVTTRATDRDGRQDESTGVVSLSGLKGDALANALMKAETKAKRRVTLSLVGLGWLDETEVETIPGSRIVDAQPSVEQPEPPPRAAEPAQPQPHWTENAEFVARFWAWCHDTLSLSDAEVLGALGVVTLSAYTGSAKEAKAAVEEYVIAAAKPEREDDGSASGKLL